SGTLTVGPSVTIRTSGGSGTVGVAGVGYSIVNQGTISAQTAGNVLFLEGQNVRNDGTWSTRDGGILRLDGFWKNATGTIVVGDNGVLEMGGQFTPAFIGNFTRAPTGMMRVVGYMDNANNIYDFGPEVGTLELGKGGRIEGGTIRAHDGA